jgi:hypothetical protein
MESLHAYGQEDASKLTGIYVLLLEMFSEIKRQM